MRLLRTALQKSVKAADWLEESDQAAVELAYHYAELIDTSIRNGDDESIKKAHAIAGPNLQRTLESLGLTVAGRHALREANARAEQRVLELSQSKPPAKSKRDEIRERREAAAREAAAK